MAKNGSRVVVPACALAVAEVRVPLLAVCELFKIPAWDPDIQ